MKQRVTTGIVGGIILVFAIFVNEWVARCAVTLILFLCMHEMIHALAGDQDAPLHVWVPYAFAFLLLPAVTFFSMQGGFILLTICVLIQFMLVVLLDKPGRLVLSVNFLPFLYPGIPAIFLQGITFLDHSQALLLLLFVSSFLSDCFALFFGLTFGRSHKHPLLPRVSPNKTVEGALGGFFGGVLFTVLAGLLLRHAGMLVISIPCLAILGFAGSFFTQAGDLTASFIKRACGIKDFGGIMPGHGGMLDRMDGVLFNAVAFYLFVLLVT
ncbi:MAG: phosphatidate cytidylyltransferase [Clostridia bacterium]|nr:phosphatidate cytidylyltransferase [Clostridia bacterium]